VTSGALSIQERVRFTLKSCLEIPDMPNGMVHSGCKDPTKATARLIIVFVSRIQKSGTGNNNHGRGHFGPNDRNDTNGQSGPQISVGPNRNGPFHLISNRNFQDFGLNLIGLIIKTLFQALSRTRSLSEIVQDCNYLQRVHSKVACLLQLQPQGTE